MTNGGHNNAPWRGTAALPEVANDLNAGRWFWVSATGGVSADARDSVYPHGSFTDAFNCVLNPDPAGVWQP